MQFRGKRLVKVLLHGLLCVYFVENLAWLKDWCSARIEIAFKILEYVLNMLLFWRLKIFLDWLFSKTRIIILIVIRLQSPFKWEGERNWVKRIELRFVFLSSLAFQLFRFIIFFVEVEEILFLVIIKWVKAGKVIS